MLLTRRQFFALGSFTAALLRLVPGLKSCRGYHSIKWPIASRNWEFGTYTAEELSHGLKFYDLRTPVKLLYPANTPYKRHMGSAA